LFSVPVRFEDVPSLALEEGSMKLFRRVLVGALVGLVLCIPAASRAQDEAEGEEAATGKSANWEVTVVKAAMYTEARRVIPGNPTSDYLEPPVLKKDCYNLALDLTMKYVGPPGDIPAPSLAVVTEVGERFGAMGNLNFTVGDFDVLGWLITLARPEPDTRSLEGGESFGFEAPITFYIGDIPLSSGPIEVLFADVAAIRISPGQL
jgi:hypothetical protein